MKNITDLVSKYSGTNSIDVTNRKNNKKTTTFLNGINTSPIKNVYSQILELCGH
jgi:hypothetical protein